jgi:ABC-2 type transport system ATP-binding protein
LATTREARSKFVLSFGVSAAALAAEQVALTVGQQADKTYAVVTRGLTKRFGKRLAVDGLDLAIPAGAISGFVGQNGAGKTTTIRMLLGLIRPTAGSGTVLGQALGHARAYLARVGALIEGPTFYPTLSGRENLLVLARLGGVENRKVDEVLERVGLGPRGLDPFRTYSLGMRQRLGIAAALLPDPELLVLDEPTNGLDPHGIAEIRAMLRSFADEGMTVFVSSHLLAEIQQVCEHLVVIDAGRLLFQGGVEELLAARAPELIVRTECGEDARRLLLLVRGTGRTVQIVGERAGTTLEIAADCSWAGDLNRLAMAAGITLVHLSERRSTLEEAFFEITGGCAKEGASREAPLRTGSADSVRCVTDAVAEVLRP